LRVLVLRLGSLSPTPGQPVMLRDAGQPIGAEISCAEGRAEWASALRGCLTWWRTHRDLAAGTWGAGILIVVLTHICEALNWFPSMRWRTELRVGHYLDLGSAVCGLTLFPVGYLLYTLTKGG
jgi:hypothetical protein